MADPPAGTVKIHLYASVNESDDIIRLGAGTVDGTPEDWFEHLPKVIRAMAEAVEQTYNRTLDEIPEEIGKP